MTSTIIEIQFECFSRRFIVSGTIRLSNSFAPTEFAPASTALAIKCLKFLSLTEKKTTLWA